jgi:hypothetical protein
MTRSISGAAHWVGRHAFPALAATVIAVGAAGGGIGYAVASQHTTTAASSSPSGAAAAAPSSAAKGHRGGAAARAGLLLQRALSLIASQTGQSVATVRSELAAGKSVDQIAGAKAAAIESQILAQITTVAGRAVSAGKITSTQESSILAMAKTKIDALMAEPGTQLLQDTRSALQYLNGKGLKHLPPPAAAAPTPAA